MGPPRAVGGKRSIKREYPEEEDTLFLSNEMIKREESPGESGDEEGEEEDSEEDSEGDSDEQDLGEQIQEIIDGFDIPYDSSAEKLPSLPAFHPDFTQAELEYVEIVKKALNVVQNAKYQDEETVRLAQQGLSIKDIKYPLGTRIALIGNSGVGKSSVINSLFDTPKLASEGSTGSSCTHVVTEFRKPLPGQKKPFAAEITFFDEGQQRVMLQKQLADYYRYFLETQEGLERATIDENKNLAMTALETFRALFCDVDQFRDDISAKAFLSSMTSEKDETVLQKLCDWRELLLESLHLENGIVTLDADQVEDLTEKVEPFTKTPPDLAEDISAPAAWPLVQMVKLGVQSSFVRTGLIVADLPGLSDTNTNRVGATQRYKRGCNFVCVVAPISRVLTDNLVDKWLEDAYERWGSNKALICTYTDDMDSNTKLRDLASTKDDIIEHNKIVNAYKAIEKEIAVLNKELKGLKGQARRPCASKKQKLLLRKAVLWSIQRESLIKLRNKRVVDGIQKRDYIQHQDGYDSQNIPMTLETTGLPALRAFLLGLPANSKFNTLKHLCEGSLPEFISSLEMWSTQSALRRKLELQKIVSKPGEIAHLEIAKLIEELRSSLSYCILNRIRDSVNHWVARGRSTSQRWATWNASTYVAFVKHEGNHATKSKVQQSWNSQLLEPVVDDLRTLWKALDETWKVTIEKYIGALTALLDTVRIDLKATPGLSMTPMDPFLSSLMPKKAMIREALEAFGKELEIVSRNVKIVATTDELDGYLVMAMAKIYAECAEHSGAGSHGRRRALIEKGITSGNPFDAIYNGVKQTFEDHLNSHQEILLRAVQGVFDRVLEDFGRQFVVKEVRSPHADKLRASLRKFCREASTKINGSLRQKLANAKAMAE